MLPSLAEGDGASSSNTAVDRPSARRTRRKLEPEQVAALERTYSENPDPDMATREELASAIDLDLKVVSTWFQNKRQADRKSTLELAAGAANAGIGPPPTAVAHPGRRSERIKNSTTTTTIHAPPAAPPKRKRARRVSQDDGDDDDDSLTEREGPSNVARPSNAGHSLGRAASESAAAFSHHPLPRTYSMPTMSVSGLVAAPPYQGRTGLVYHVYPVTYTATPSYPYPPPPPMGMPPPMFEGGTHPRPYDAFPHPYPYDNHYGHYLPVYEPDTGPFSRTPSLVSNVPSAPSPLQPDPDPDPDPEHEHEEVSTPSTPPSRKRKALWESLPSSSPSSASGGGGLEREAAFVAREKRRTLEWACARARLRGSIHEKEEQHWQDDEAKKAAMALCEMKGAPGP